MLYDHHIRLHFTTAIFDSSIAMHYSLTPAIRPIYLLHVRLDLYI